jgi:hypothetical protein
VTTIPPNLSGGTTVACPAGTILTGGGYFGSNSPDLFVFYSAPLTDAWGAYAMNTSSSNLQLTAYAVCLTGPAGLSTQVVDVGGTVPPKGQPGGSGVSATCPQGSLLTGGGFRNSYANSNDNIMVEVQINTPVSESGNWWAVMEVNDAPTSVLETTYAICLFGASSLFSSTIVSNVNIDNPGTSLVVNCPSGNVLTGGGDNVELNTLDVTTPIMAIASYENSSNSWEGISAGDFNHATGWVDETSAVCLSSPPASPSPVTPIPIRTLRFPGPIFTPHLNAYCRSGPDQIFNSVSLAMNGQAYPIVGRNQENTYYLLGLTNQVECWVLLSSGEASGNLASIPVMLPIPTPTSTPKPIQANCSIAANQKACQAIPGCVWQGSIFVAGGKCSKK